MYTVSTVREPGPCNENNKKSKRFLHIDVAFCKALGNFNVYIWFVLVGILGDSISSRVRNWDVFPKIVLLFSFRIY